MSRHCALWSREIHVLRLFACTLIPPGSHAVKSPSDAQVAERLSEGLRLVRLDIRLLFRLALFLFEWIALFLYAKPFSRLSESRRVAYYYCWHGSRLPPKRALLRILETFCFVYYYSDPEVAQSIGYDEAEPLAAVDKDTPHGILEMPSRDITEEVDVCVIGSGAGGAVVAAELAERGHRVLVVEEGPYFSIPDFKDNTVSINQKIYRDAGFVTTYGRPPILLPVGCCVGGTTVINSGTCYRTPDTLISAWNTDGLTGVTPESLLPYFERVEKRLGVAPVAPDVFGENNRTILKGIEALGMTGVALVRNAPGCQGSGHCIYGCLSGAKQSMERSYLPAAFAAGARLYAQCKVTKIVRRGDRIVEIKGDFYRAKGVKAGVSLTVRAKLFIVACGTLHTPVLLDRNRLARESGQLGRNLSLHPAAKTVALFDREIGGIAGVPQGLGIEELHDEGLLFEGVFLPPSALSASLLLPRERHKEIMEAYKRLAVFGFLVSDTSRGRVVTLPTGGPLVLYSMNKKDTTTFVKGLSLCSRISFAAGAKKVFLTVHGLPELNHVGDVDRLSQRRVHPMDLEVAAFHPLGTARMGADPKHSVIDPQLRVHDLANLYIADGSIFPSSLGVNPQESIMAFATRLAAHLHSEIL